MTTLQVSLPHSTTNPKYLESNSELILTLSTAHRMYGSLVLWVCSSFRSFYTFHLYFRLPSPLLPNPSLQLTISTAELIDNSVDAGATRLDIDAETVQKKPVLLVTDNGKGMDTTHLHLMLSFGHCSKAESDIGRYGNGFKSGSMRVGRDALVFTRTQQPAVITVGLLSQTFLADIHADEVLVPIVSWNADTFQLQTNSALGHRSSTSLETILKHSPFSTTAQLFAMFDRIDAPSGTCIMIYNLKKNEHSEKYELEFDDKQDIRTRNQVVNMLQSQPRERHSLRAYCAILYLNPSMSIFIRGKRVRSIRISSTLLEAKKYIYQSKKHGIPIIFGFVPKEEDKAHFGVMMYYNNRLIKGYVHVGSQLVHTNSVGKGVIGVVQANWLQPTHNKQDFYLGENKAKQYDLLISALGEKLKQYWSDIGIAQKGIGIFTKALWSKKPQAPKRKVGVQKVARKIERKPSAEEPHSAKAKTNEGIEKYGRIKAESESEDEGVEVADHEEDIPLQSLRSQTLLLKSSSPAPAITTCAPPTSANPLTPTSLFPPACKVNKATTTRIPKSEPISDGVAERKVPVTCTQCFKWRMVSMRTANNLPDDWTCSKNPDPDQSSCDDPEEDPEGNIPKAPRRKEVVPVAPVEERVTELRTELSSTREQFDKKDRARARKLKELEAKMDGSFTSSTIYGEEIVGKTIWVYWRVCDNWVAGKVTGYISKKGAHKVTYKTGEDETLRLDDEDVYFDDPSIPPSLHRVPISGTLPNGAPLSVGLCTSGHRDGKGQQDHNHSVQKIPKARKSVYIQTEPIPPDSPVPVRLLEHRPATTPDKDKSRDRTRDRDTGDWVHGGIEDKGRSKDGAREERANMDRDRGRDRDRDKNRDRDWGKDKDRGVDRGGRVRDEAGGRKRDRSRSTERRPKRNRSGSPHTSGAQAELDALRASVKRFLQLQYPINSAEAEASEENVATIFSEHVNKIECEAEVDLN